MVARCARAEQGGQCLRLLVRSRLGTLGLITPGATSSCATETQATALFAKPVGAQVTQAVALQTSALRPSLLMFMCVSCAFYNVTGAQMRARDLLVAGYNWQISTLPLPPITSRGSQSRYVCAADVLHSSTGSCATCCANWSTLSAGCALRDMLPYPYLYIWPCCQQPPVLAMAHRCQASWPLVGAGTITAAA
jgi:hypothetical protein